MLALRELAFAAVVAVSAAHAQTIVFVDADAPPGGDGASWETAYNELRDALMSSTPEEIWVAEGVYAPAPAGGERTATFEFSGTLRVYGGFAGGETSLEQRDVAANETILSGDINADDDEGRTGDNAYNVVRLDYPMGAVLDGFTITAGRAFGPDQVLRRGGGLYTSAWESQSATVANCRFVDNVAAYRGGGLYAKLGQVTIEGCRFENNRARTHAAGAYLNVQTGSVRRCAFVENVSRGGSGGLGGGVILLEECLFEGNVAYGPGGATNSWPLARSCVFIGNRSLEAGGAYYASAPIVQCVFVDNEAPIGGGVHSTAPVLNSVFFRNVGGGIERPNDYALTQNCVLWKNTPEQVSGGLVEYSCVQGGHPGEGNIDEDPAFEDAGGLRFRPRPGSPLIDAGRNENAVDLVETDLAGLPRVVDDGGTPDTGDGDGALVDMGVYEFQGNSCPANVNGDDTLSVLDFVVFQILFQTDDPAADFDGDGALTVLDFVAFQAAFVDGCP